MPQPLRLIRLPIPPRLALSRYQLPPRAPTPYYKPLLLQTQAVEESEVKLLGVSLGTESGLILVQFKAPPALTRHWQQTDLYVIDESTGAVYNEVPVMPVIGPLFARPNQAGQIGYVMLVNAPVPLQSGALVIVYLGEYIFEHVQVK